MIIAFSNWMDMGWPSCVDDGVVIIRIIVHKETFEMKALEVEFDKSNLKLIANIILRVWYMSQILDISHWVSRDVFL